MVFVSSNLGSRDNGGYTACIPTRAHLYQDLMHENELLRASQLPRSKDCIKKTYCLLLLPR